MSTHSGLTRWQDFLTDEDANIPEDHFSKKVYHKAIDEVWYKRAVEQHYVNPDSFVFSVPIDEWGADNTTIVTASRAIFIGKANRQTLISFRKQYQPETFGKSSIDLAR